MEKVNHELEVKKASVIINSTMELIVEEYEEGNLSILDAVLFTRELKAISESIINDVKQFETKYIDIISQSAKEYLNGYKGFKISEVNKSGNITYDGIQEVEALEKQLKAVKAKYKSAFDGVLKGTVTTLKEEDVLYWVDPNGELLRLPDRAKGSSYINVKAV